MYFTLDRKPTETKNQNQDEKMETSKEENSKEEAKKINEEGNAHYRKKELDMAIQKYDEVILTHNMARKLTSKNYPKIVTKSAQKT